jgi:hypothetical protein
MAKTTKEKEVKKSLIERIKENSTIKETDILSESEFFANRVVIPVSIPAINIALSGDLDGGISSGMTMWAGPSKHFKTLFALILLKTYLEYYPDGVGILYDSEFGAPFKYFDALNIPKDRVVHVPVLDIEHLKIEMMQQIELLEKGDHVMHVTDSIGNIASIKEVTDAMNEKIVADMSRAKALKSLFRVITPRCIVKDMPWVVVNHTYKEQSMFPKDIVSGGTGSYYNSENIFILGRQQEKKEGKPLEGYNFTIRVEKSRSVQEGSKIDVTVLFDTGIDKWSSILELGLESGYLIKPTPQTLHYVGDPTEIVYKTTKIPDIMYENLVANQGFKDWIKEKFQLSNIKLIDDEDGVVEIPEDIDTE